MNNRKPLVTFENVTLRVGDRWILPKTCWQIRRGEHWIIHGPNGAGKTTLANALMGRGAVVQGRIHRHYEHERGRQGIKPIMAMVSSEQYHQIYAREMLLKEMRNFSGKLEDQTLGCAICPMHQVGGTARKDDWANIPKLLELKPLFTKSVEALSSGEMRRVLLARALMQEPQVLILDEPFNGLDTATRKTVQRLIDFLAATDTQIILITHRLEDIPSYFSHVLFLDQGRVCRNGIHKDFLELQSAEKNLLGVADAEPGSHSSSVFHNTSTDSDADMGILIRMRETTVHFGENLILDKLNWKVRTGENWAVCGPNGAGKSTLLKLITGDHLQAYANDITLFGKKRGEGESIWEIKHHIGYVSDEFQARYQHKLTGFDVICSGFFDSVGLNKRCTPGQLEIADHWIDTLKLDDVADRLFNNLSFGKQRMILIARAMVKSPRLLILDEPCNGLDITHRKRILEIIDNIGRNPEMTMIIVCHRAQDLPACITHQLTLFKKSSFDFGPQFKIISLPKN